MTPTGVEHNNMGTLLDEIQTVNVTMTPTGVEHTPGGRSAKP
jgi:hypothetical protein